MDSETVFGTPTPVVGMVHLPPLPGAPRYDPDAGREHCHEVAHRDARRLERGGVDAVLVENYGDAPYHPDDVPDSTVADLTALAGTVDDAVDLPVGVNVLRNDATAAVAVAAAVEAAFVRVNVHVGARATGQGVVEGRAHETVRLRDRIDADVAILADVDVKHSAPLAPDATATVDDAVERGLADAVVVSGDRTGDATDREVVERAVDRRDERGLDAPVFVGSGVTPETAGDLLAVADGAIVGTALKAGGETTAPVDVERVEELVAAADAVR